MRRQRLHHAPVQNPEPDGAPLSVPKITTLRPKCLRPHRTDTTPGVTRICPVHGGRLLGVPGPRHRWVLEHLRLDILRGVHKPPAPHEVDARIGTDGRSDVAGGTWKGGTGKMGGSALDTGSGMVLDFLGHPLPP